MAHYRPPFLGNAGEGIAPSKLGEGKKFLGGVQVHTNANGVAKFQATVKRFKVNKTISATATDPAGFTSEFSKCVKAQ
jgi:hypothetical protein